MPVARVLSCTVDITCLLSPSSRDAMRSCAVIDARSFADFFLVAWSDVFLVTYSEKAASLMAAPPPEPVP